MAQRPAVVEDVLLELRWLNPRERVMDRRWIGEVHKPLLARPNQDRMRRQPKGNIAQALNDNLSMNPTIV